MQTDHDLDHARALVRDSETQIDFQQRIIEALRSNGQPTRAADKFMLRLKDTLQARRDHRDAVATRVYGLELTDEA